MMINVVIRDEGIVMLIVRISASVKKKKQIITKQQEEKIYLIQYAGKIRIFTVVVLKQEYYKFYFSIDFDS